MLKTQTRRVVKQPTWVTEYEMLHLAAQRPATGLAYCVDGRPRRVMTCPYGAPGDFLWVRETWRVAAWREERGVLALDYRASPEEVRTPWLSPGDEVFQRLWEQSTVDAERALAAGRGSVEQRRDGGYRWDRGDSPCRWRSPRFMPRWASRISLRVEAVRVERLQAITEEDAKAEGVTPYTSIGPDQVVPGPGFNGARLGDQPHRLPFADLWRNINGAESWGANPWVWVVTFARADSIPEGAKARPILFSTPMVRAILGSP